MLKDRSSDLEMRVEKLLRSVGADSWRLTPEEREDIVDRVCQLDEACGGLPDEWGKDIWVMLSRANRMNLQGLVAAIEECTSLGGMFRGADWACDELLSFVEGWRAAYGFPPLTEKQRRAMSDRVRRASEKSGGRMATHWMLTLIWMATERSPQSDIYEPMIDALDYCVRHGGLDAPNGQAVMAGYLGPPSESKPELVMMRIAREASDWLSLEQRLPKGLDGYTKVLNLVKLAWRRRDVLAGGEWGGGENWAVWFGCEWIRLVSEGTDPVPALIWIHILDSLRKRMGEGSERWLTRVSPVSMCEEDGVFTLAIDDSSDARFVLEEWGTVIEGEIGRIVGRSMKVEIWDDDSNVWSLSAA